VFSTVSPSHPGVQGRPRKVHTKVEDSIKDFLNEYPITQLDKVCDFLNDEYNIRTSLLIVSRCLKRI
jgi:transposase